MLPVTTVHRGGCVDGGGMRVEVEAFSDDAIACKDAFQVGPNYKPGGATFGAGAKTPIDARLVTYL